MDSVVFSSVDTAERAIAQLRAGQLDIYAYVIPEADWAQTVQQDPTLDYTQAYDVNAELTLYPATFTDGRLNPFSNYKIREAMNWLVDRNYIAREIYGGLAVPRLFPFPAGYPDYMRYLDTCFFLEADYTYNPSRAATVIATEMQAMGASLVDGKWHYKGEEIALILLLLSPWWALTKD